jgi:hypothetical protein
MWSALIWSFQAGGWITRNLGVTEVSDMTPHDRRRFVEAEARLWLVRTELVQRAYDDHPEELKLLVRYEDLCGDTSREVRRIRDWLGLQASDDEVDRVVARLDFDALPAAQKGKGMFTRSATPGGWRNDLTDDEQDAVEAILGPKLEELGYPVQPRTRASGIGP